MSEFVHLHLHTQYSVLDGANKIKRLAARAKEYGHSAVAITDHGNMHGAIEFYQEMMAAEVKPIIGCEVYITPGSRHEKKTKTHGGAGINHLTLLAKDMEGYRNLCKLVSIAYIEGFYFKPRIDHEILAEFSKGLICLSGCLSGEFASFARTGDLEGARTIAEKYRDVFGENFYLEVQPHNIPEQQAVNKIARDVGTSLGLPLVATNDCHYLDPEDHHAQEVLMCVSTGKLITDPDRIRHEGASLHLKTAEEMVGAMPEFEDGVRHSLDIAAACNVNFDFSTYHMPKFEPPAEVSLEDHFAAEGKRGLEIRFEDLTLSEEEKKGYYERLELEIGIIEKMGFPGYFLVVADFCNWAKRNDIPVGPGRGSGAGSLVAWALAITEIDPIKNNLLFERFLNPERISMPDFDIDFCIHGRDRVIEYVTNKYGKDKVAQIVTFGTLKAKAAIKDVGRVLGLSYAETDRIAKLIPAPRQGFDYPIAEALKMEKRLSDYANGEGKELIDLAQKLEGLSRHTSTHAAGLVISDRPVVEYLPLMVDKDQQVVTQFSMNYVEKIGLVKFDFLGLKTLTVLHEAVRLIHESTGKSIELNKLPLDDAQTYRLISSGRTIGVFQLESSGITEMVTRLKPSDFEDLVAILALYRPGPLDAGMVDHYINRKHGREAVRYSHPVLEPILNTTYGIILYQEQIMRIAQDMAGYSLGEADMLRRAMGKKKPEEMAKQRERFLDGAKLKEVSDKVAVDVFDQMETFARYGFNRSHSVAYAMISFQTAYLKAHYPLYFLAALMTCEMGDTDKTLKNINECQEMGIKIVAPDVNRGDIGFNVVENKILFGLAALKGIGAKAVERLMQERAENGPFLSLLDFCKRIDSSFVNRRALESLIKSGGFDWTGMPRAELIARTEDVLKRAQKIRANAETNQIGLFDSQKTPEDEVYRPNRPLLTEWPSSFLLAQEREALGLYLSGHPLEKFRAELQRFGSSPISSLRGNTDGNTVNVAGVITLLKLKNTKKGDRYATFLLEDMTERLEVIVWPDVYEKTAEALSSEDPVIVIGRLDVSDERRTLIAQDLQSALAVRKKTAREAIVRLQEDKCSTKKLNALKALFSEYQGPVPVKLIISKSAHSEVIVALPHEMNIKPSEKLCNKVEQLFGEPVVTFR